MSKEKQVAAILKRGMDRSARDWLDRVKQFGDKEELEIVVARHTAADEPKPEIEAEEVLQYLLALIRTSLSEESACVFIQRSLEGKSFEEIGANLAISHHTARRRWNEALPILQSVLSREDVQDNYRSSSPPILLVALLIAGAACVVVWMVAGPWLSPVSRAEVESVSGQGKAQALVTRQTHRGDGSLLSEWTELPDGRKHGFHTTYHRNGQKWQQLQWVQGERAVYYREWAATGVLTVERPAD